MSPIYHFIMGWREFITKVFGEYPLAGALVTLAAIGVFLQLEKWSLVAYIPAPAEIVSSMTAGKALAGSLWQDMQTYALPELQKNCVSGRKYRGGHALGAAAIYGRRGSGASLVCKQLQPSV
jgi:hypothetical protein